MKTFVLMSACALGLLGCGKRTEVRYVDREVHVPCDDGGLVTSDGGAVVTDGGVVTTDGGEPTLDRETACRTLQEAVGVRIAAGGDAGICITDARCFAHEAADVTDCELSQIDACLAAIAVAPAACNEAWNTFGGCYCHPPVAP